MVEPVLAPDPVEGPAEAFEVFLSEPVAVTGGMRSYLPQPWAITVTFLLLFFSVTRKVNLRRYSVPAYAIT